MTRASNTAFLAGVMLLCIVSSALALNYADIYARSRELPAERELLDSISFSIQKNPGQAVMTRRTLSNSTFTSRHSMSLSFKALGREFSASLHHNNDLFHPKAVVSVFSEGELVETYSPQSRAYLGEATIDGREQASVSAVVADYDQGIFHMSIWNAQTGESYVVEPTYLHPELSKKRSEGGGMMETLSGGNMVVFKEHWDELPFAPRNVDQAEEEGEQPPVSCGTGDIQEGEEDAEDVVDPTSSCPPRSASYLLMGVATDNQYVRKAGGTSGTPNTISYVWSTMQGHYYTAVRNKPVIKSLVINSSPSSSSSSSSTNFNTASCPSDVQTRLTPFCNWRVRQTDRTIGLWHLLSGCLPDRTGVAGRAYYSALCRYTTQGCGITGYLGGNARWVIPAHEIGHNYGARHSSNIMAPSVNSRATGFAQTSINDMCRYTFSVSARTACLLDRLPEDQSPTLPDQEESSSEEGCECKKRSQNVVVVQDSESAAATPSSALLEALF
ncbi:hypothetical protein QOT17_010025 [Balamuthia mandrillaris]